MAIDDHRPLAPVSVVIPAFNASETIGRALRSIAGQTLRPSEVVVVDDGSADNTPDIAEQVARDIGDLTIRVVRQSNKGAGAARNRALGEACCEYVAFLDADDEWLPEKLSESMSRLADSDFVLVGHNGWVVTGETETYLDCARRFQAAHPRLYDGFYRRGFLGTSSVVARRDAIAQIGGFDETLRTGQDFDLWLRLLDWADSRFTVFETPLTKFHIVPGSITSHTRRRLGDTMEIAIRHAPSLARHGASPLRALWFRLAAIHAEAVVAYWNRREFAKAAFILLEAPVSFMRATMHILGATTSRWLSLGLAWVVLATAIYLYQFRDLIAPILRVINS